MRNAWRYWAWLASGVLLDAALTAVCQLAVIVVVPSSFYDQNVLWHVAPPGSALTFVHVILLPALVWPGRDLTARDLAKVFALALAIPSIALLSIAVGLIAGLVSVMFLLAWAFFMPLLVLGGAAAGFFAGGATCCGLAAWIAKAFRGEPGQVAFRIRTAALGGGAAALVLFVFVGLPEMKKIANDEAVSEPGLLQLSVLLALAGLPHLLLTCQDMARQPPAFAAFPVAARRFFVVLTLSGCSGVLLLAAAHGRS